MLRLRGVGLPNAYAVNGVVQSPDGTSYRDADGLMKAIALAICLRSGALSAAELRFLRKKVGFTQQEVADLGGKTDQIVIQWEKGSKPVPKAESTLLRLTWLAKFAKRHLPAVVKSAGADDSSGIPCDFVFRFSEDGGWQEDRLTAESLANQSATVRMEEAITKASWSSSAQIASADGAVFASGVIFPSRIRPTKNVTT